MTIPRRSDAFVSRKLGEETIVVPVRAGVANLEAIFTMNVVGSTIWNRIDGRASLDDLTRAVESEFAVTSEAAAADVAAFVELLAAKGLIVAAEGGP
jgi:MinD-like ATPase involved in chromosome partitioning or flagellar assembly